MTYRLDRRGLLSAFAGSALMSASPGWAAGARPFFRRIGKPLGVQLYAMGDAAQNDLANTLRRLAKIGYGEFELPGLFGRDPKSLRADADMAGVRYSSIHLHMNRLAPSDTLSLASSPQAICDALGALRISKVVVPTPLLPEGFAFGKDEDPMAAFVKGVRAGGLDMWKRLGAMLNERALALRPFGIELGYHNHNMEFQPQDGTTGWQALLDQIDPALVFLELDLAWVAAAGVDVAGEIERIGHLKRRIRMVHLKDIKATTTPNYALHQDPAEVGAGSLDWRRILPACARAGVEHYFVEREPPFPSDRFQGMATAYAFLSRIIA